MKKLTRKLWVCFVGGLFLFGGVTNDSMVYADNIIRSGISIGGDEFDVQPFYYEVNKNYRETNYRILSDWYYSHDVKVGFDVWFVGGISQIYKVYARDVSKDIEYDVYDGYTGDFLYHYKNTVRYKETKRILQE